MRKTGTGAVVVVLFATMLSSGVSQAREPDFRVQAGALHPDIPERPYEYTAYYPTLLKVHRGQMIRWEVVGDGIASGFHTITFAAERPAFLRADELPGSYATPEAWAFGSDCGRNGLAACVLTEDSTFISSGIPPLGNSPFDVILDVPVGTYSYFCTVHPAMAGAVQVVADTEPVPTAEQVAQQVADDIAADSAAADTLWDADQQPVSTIEDGQRVWQVLLGDSTEDNRVSLVSFLPADLAIEAGDKVRYLYRDRIINEVHTVTFPSAVTGGFTPVPHGLGGFGFHFSCDFDGRETGARGIPGAWGVAGPDCPAEAELTLAPWMSAPTPAPGNLVLTPATYHDSGLLIPPSAPENFRRFPDTGELLPSSFEAEFPLAGSFVFECNVHVDPMTATITVS